ncbi:MAG: Flagellar regulatory protein FleQ [Labilithrix sp.]|nr:Flagellar regulatory protein FleQ [Labilithrix sp.]
MSRSTLPPPSAGTILLVEDDERLARSLTRMLQGGGYDVVHARDGEEAIETVRGRTFDAVFSDLNLPGVGGVAVLTAARQTDPDLPLVLMTGDPTPAAEDAAVALGVVGYLTKPTSRAALTRALRRVNPRALSLRAVELEATDDAPMSHAPVTIPPPSDYRTTVWSSANVDSVGRL